MHRPSAGRRLDSGWRGAWFVPSRRCAEHCNTTVTPSGPLADAACGVLLGGGAEQRPYCLDRFLRRRPMRVVLDVQLTGEDLGEVDLDTGTDGEVQLPVSADH